MDNPAITPQSENPGLLLHGAQAIAKFLGLTERQVRHRIADGILPTFKIGGTVCAVRTSLVDWLESQEREARTVAGIARRARRKANQTAWALRHSAAKSSDPDNPDT